jgi:hypothetical protein
MPSRLLAWKKKRKNMSSFEFRALGALRLEGKTAGEKRKKSWSWSSRSGELKGKVPKVGKRG